MSVAEKYRQKYGLTDDEEEKAASEAPAGTAAERALARLEARKATEQEAAAAQAEIDANAPSAIESFGAGALQGATFNLADEAEGYIGAFLDKVTGLDKRSAEALGVEPTSFSENAAQLAQAERDELAESRRANPGAFMAGEITGGIATPANFVGPGALVNAGRLGSTSGRLGLQAARAAAEGAVAGAGAADPGDRLETGTLGALLGGGTAGILGAATRGLTKARVAEDALFDAQGRQVPLNLIDEPDSGLPGFYQNYVGRTVGGRGALRRQGQPFLEEAADTVEQRTAVAEAGKTAREQQVNQELARRTAARDAGLSQAKAAEKARVAAEKAALDDEAWQATLDVAIPPTMPKEVAEEVRNAGSRLEGLEVFDDWWRDNAFQTVSGYSQINLPNNFVSEIRRLVGRNPEFKEALGKGQWKRLQDAVDANDLSGRELMEIRNTFARAANKTPSLQGAAARGVADKFDNFMKRKGWSAR